VTGAPGGLSIREIRFADLPAVIELVGRCDRTYLDWAPAGWQPPALAWYRESWEHRLGQADTWARGAFGPGGELAAVVGLRQDRTSDGRLRPGVAQVFALFVDPGRWRTGVGSALLALAEREIAARGFGQAALWTPEGAPARRFYEAQGWRASGARTFFERLGLPLVRYEKRIEGVETARPRPNHKGES